MFEVLMLIGRISFALVFMASGGAGHLGMTEGTAGYAESRGVPNSRALTLLSGLFLVAGGLGVILGIGLDVAALGLSGYSLVSALMVHHFWSDDEPLVRQVETTSFMKNLAIAGGGVIIFALAASGTDMGWTLTDPVLTLR